MVEYYSNSSMIFCALEKDARRSGRFPLKWKKSQRLDISSYSILRSSPGESSPWARAWLLQERCLTPPGADADNPFAHGVGSPTEPDTFTTIPAHMPFSRTPQLISQEPQHNDILKRGLTQMAEIIIALTSPVSTLSTKIYTALEKETRGIVKFGQEHPQLRYSFLSFLLVIFSVCLGNCMPRFIV